MFGVSSCDMTSHGLIRKIQCQQFKFHGCMMRRLQGELLFGREVVGGLISSGLYEVVGWICPRQAIYTLLEALDSARGIPQKEGGRGKALGSVKHYLLFEKKRQCKMRNFRHQDRTNGKAGDLRLCILP